MSKTSEEIIGLVRDAGVVGAAGTGFPTYIKLQSKVETVIVNGAECEPLLYTDKTILKDRSEDVIEGLKLAMVATGAREGIIALNRTYSSVIDAIENAIQNIIPTQKKNIRIHLLEDYYPAGDEFLMVYDVTKKSIPEGGSPKDVGVLVANVLTIVQIYNAVNGKPATERVVTITGAVTDPKVVSVPVGTPYSELIILAGGTDLKEYGVIDGGPMMGNLVTDLNDGIGKTTTGIIVLPLDHFVIKMKLKTPSQSLKESKSISCQCSHCTDMCPRHLLGHEVFPQQSINSIHFNMAEPTKHVTSAFLCSQCGLCEVVGCASVSTSPKKVFGEFKKLLALGGVKNPHTRSNLSVHSQFENRKLSLRMLIKKLGITQYRKHLAFEKTKEINFVKISTQKHIGASAVATIKIGQFVRRGDVIALSPADQMGSIYHASIHGKISAVTDHFIEITGQYS